ncbi:MAG TPA: hypothetical protein ENK66_08305 [Arcobacter sp.]|nr:hypothetical protein [Arcobacter sp.]
MSLKDNVDYIKEELSNEEKFLESSLRVEKFYKKYKYVIFGVIGLVLVYFIGSAIVDYNAQNTKTKANITYENIINNPQDTQALDELKSLNEKLYQIALYKTNQQNSSVDVIYLKDLQAYKKAVASNDIKALDSLIASQDFLLKDFALLTKALILIEKQEYAKAKSVIKMVPQESQVAQVVTMLEHFLITK